MDFFLVNTVVTQAAVRPRWIGPLPTHPCSIRLGFEERRGRLDAVGSVCCLQGAGASEHCIVTFLPQRSVSDGLFVSVHTCVGKLCSQLVPLDIWLSYKKAQRDFKADLQPPYDPVE